MMTLPPMPRVVSLLALAALMLPLASCKDEQVYYELEGEEAEQYVNRQTGAAEAVATATPEPTPSPTPGTQTVRATADAPAGANVAGFEIPLPEGWTATPQDELGPMRAAEFHAPAPEGEGEGPTLVIYYFGPGQGGTAQANIDRWIGQMEVSGEPRTGTAEVGGLTVTTVMARGTLLPSRMPMAGGSNSPVPGSALYGAVIEGGPRGSVFFKMTGQEEAVEAVLPEVNAIIATMAGES
ncbi:MAG: hypothetical protein RLY93_17550 [Sumerlaeia bacterium]